MDISYVLSHHAIPHTETKKQKHQCNIETVYKNNCHLKIHHTNVETRFILDWDCKYKKFTSTFIVWRNSDFSIERMELVCNLSLHPTKGMYCNCQCSCVCPSVGYSTKYLRNRCRWKDETKITLPYSVGKACRQNEMMTLRKLGQDQILTFLH